MNGGELVDQIRHASSQASIPILMALSAVLPPEWPSHLVFMGIVTVLALVGWGGLAREIRGKTLSIRESDFVLAARVCGAKDGRILFRHLLPSMFSHIIVIATLAIPGFILGESTLSFLGLGIKPPMTTVCPLRARMSEET